MSAECDSVDAITPEAVAVFCRDKGKVEAATCIADVLNAETAEEIGSVARLLRVLDDLSQQ